MWGVGQWCRTEPCVLLGSSPGCGARTVRGAALRRTGCGATGTRSHGQTARSLGTQPRSRIASVCRAVPRAPAASLSPTASHGAAASACQRHSVPAAVGCTSLPPGVRRDPQSRTGFCRAQDMGMLPLCTRSILNRQSEKGGLWPVPPGHADAEFHTAPGKLAHLRPGHGALPQRCG